MSKKREKKIVSFQDGENNMLIISERRTGEDKTSHDMRIEMMRKIMVEGKSGKAGKYKLTDLVGRYLGCPMKKCYKSKVN